MRLLQTAAIALTGLALCLLAAPGAQAARSEFFGVDQGPPLDEADIQSINATGIKTARFLLGWRGSSGARPSRLARRRTSGRHTSPRTGSGGPRSSFGSPSWTRTGRPLAPPGEQWPVREAAWEDFLKAAVGRYGPGGSYWTNAYHHQFGACRSAAPDPVLADLERAEHPARVLSGRHRRPGRPQIRRAGADLPRRDQVEGSPGHGRLSPA